MNNISYKNTLQMINGLKNSYKTICEIKQKNHDWFKDSFFIIRTSYISAKNALRNTKSLPSDNNGNIRILSYAEEFFLFNENNLTPENLVNYLSDVSEKISLQNDEISLIPEIFKTALIFNLAKDSIKNDSDAKKRTSNAIKSLHTLNNYIFEDLYEKLSICETVLNKDETYRYSDRKSKDIYRFKISQISKQTSKEEIDVVYDLLEKASKIKSGKKSTLGYYLFKKTKLRYFYFPVILLLTSLSLLLVYISIKNIVITIFSSLIIFYICKYITDKIFSFSKAKYVTRLKLNKVPKTLVTIVTLINNEKSVDNLFEKCIRYMYSNNTEGLLFGFLADLPESLSPLTPQDNSLVSYAVKKVKELNLLYGNKFFIAIREKSLNQDNGTYKGRERKRGAIEDFLNAIEKQTTDNFVKIYGDVYEAKYFTALDGDTKPGINSIKELISVLENPLNEPKSKAFESSISEGYAIAVPRIETETGSVMQNLFTKIFGGKAGSEVYSYPSFNVYQDIFEEGIFAGKGVINIKLFNKILSGILNTGAVLSHDIIEGVFLRTVYVSDVVFYDKTPKNLLSYASRHERWVRGDWQNIRYICNKFKKKDGSTVNSSFSMLSKFKILDNVLRTLLNTNLYVLVFIAAVMKNPSIFIVAFIYIFKGFLSEVFDSIFHPKKFIPFLYQNGNLTNLTRALLYDFSNFLFLPYFSYCEIIAISKAIYRQITKKKLLDWTTSEQSDSKNLTLLGYSKKMLPQLSSLIFLINLWTLPLTLLWISAIPFAYYSSLKKENKKLSMENDSLIKDMWKYFEDFLCEEFNYLPPDNFQEKPLGICAPRTSPTNIGLTMLCILGAYDMGFINEDKMVFYIDKILSAVEDLETYEGHLLNWYDIKNKSSLYPRYVSTVDNGNFACCLYTLKNGLMELKSVSASTLIIKAERILKNMDFSLLYDNKRNLFHIGLDVENNKLSESYYDLYESESRLTSYYAIANGQISAKHWSYLGRPIVTDGIFLGVKSWSGTTFEYLMPHLFLPLNEGSFDQEAVLFSIKTQIMRTRGKKAETNGKLSDIPWGISESCYYVFGSDLSYQYKAFGAKLLALQNGVDSNNEIVISPYSTLLSIPFDNKNSNKNLKLLSNYFSKGKYGYYEAIDFHKASENYIPKTVQSFMVHHIGMSFISLLNLKKENIMQKRFMDRKMSSFSLLLEERAPEFSDYSTIGEEKTQPKKDRYVGKLNGLTEFNPELPNCMAYSDEETSLVLTDCGESITKFKGKDVTSYNKNDYNGVFSFFKTEKNVIPFTYAPLNDNELSYKCTFNYGNTEYETKARSFELKQVISIIQNRSCEIREFTVKNNSSSEINGEILIYFEPILQNRKDYKTHPAFSNLFIEAYKDEITGALTFIRRNRNDGKGEAYLTVGFDKQIKYDYELSKFNLIKTNEGKKSLKNAFEIKFTNDTRGPVSACCAIKFKLSLGPKSKETFKMLLSFGIENKFEDLIQDKINLKQISDDNEYSIMKTFKKYKIESDDIRIFEILLNSVFSKKNIQSNSSTHKNVLDRRNLWKFSISGDTPLIVIKISEETLSNSSNFIKAFALLKHFNVDCEMVFCFNEELGYERKIQNSLVSDFINIGIDKYVGVQNGIFMVNMRDIKEYALLCSIAAYIADFDKGWKVSKNKIKFREQNVLDVTPIKVPYKYKTGIGGFVENGFAIDDKNAFDNKPPWCNVLANKTFGTLISDCSLGFTYAFNSYKNKITPWENDVTKDNNGEKLYLIFSHGKEKRTYDLIKKATAIFKENSVEYHCEAENVFVKITIFVPEKINAKIISVKIENPSDEDIKLRFEPHIIMNDFECGNTVNYVREGNILYFSNAYNSDYSNGTVFLTGHGMRPEGNKLIGNIKPNQSEEKIIILGYGQKRKIAKNLAEVLTAERIKKELENLKCNNKNSIKIKTPSEELNLLYNFFLTNQIVKCRIFAKTGFYQCSGAYGFRDQLQDSICISTLDSSFLKHQILECASHQFLEGDVMHWFHLEKTNNDKICGVRTKSSDDLLWLPYAICEYVEKTADFAFLAYKRRYIEAQKLNDFEDEKYVEADTFEEYATVYEHGKQAIKKAITKGEHGLLKFGSGDWNDGLNKITDGETVWGTFFIIIVLERYAKLSKKVGDSDFTDYCLKTAEEYRKAIEENAWSEDRFIRGFLNSKDKFGDESSTECKIDLISQSFAAICERFNDEMVRTALNTAYNTLVDNQNSIVKLFDPPFKNQEVTPGYIIGYIPGVRENGGQYTHAAVWFALALIKSGKYNEAFEILNMINPINHSRTLNDVKKYRVEPYVLSADVYTNPAHFGMGGWSWYTGSAGWYFKTVTEELLGIKQDGKYLTVNPHLPENWDSFSAEIKKDGTTVNLTVIRSADLKFSKKLFINNLEMKAIPLDGKNHKVKYFI